MPFPTFDPDIGGSANLDANSRHAFPLNSHAWTVSISATNFGNVGIDLQSSIDNGLTWTSVLLPRGPVKRTHCQHSTLSGLHRFLIPTDATGVVATLTSP